MRKYSRQREIILEYLYQTTAHPTADQIYADLKPQYPALGLSTVYRNLRLLAEDGIIRRLDTGEGVDRFDADLSAHNHFICLKCRRVSDVFETLIEPKSLEDALGKAFSVNSHSLYIYGVCDGCNQG